MEYSIYLIILIIFFFTFVFITYYFHKTYPELKWDWKDINLNKINFPNNFIWGTATAAHQIEGSCENNWSEFEKGYKYHDKVIKHAKVIVSEGKK